MTDKGAIAQLQGMIEFDREFLNLEIDNGK